MSIIRRVDAEDITAVARITVDVWRSTYRGIVPDRFLQELDYKEAETRWEKFLQRPQSVPLLAEVSGEAVGYAMAGKERSGSSEYNGEIYAIYVRDEHHGKGLGRSLLAVAASELSAMGIDSLLIWVLDGNPAAGFYKALGGVLVAQKEIEIGGVSLPESAYGWSDIRTLLIKNDS